MKELRDLSRPKHTLFLSSSDEDEKKSMPNVSRKKKKKYDRKESSTKEECPIDLEMKKTKSDSKERSEKKSKVPKHTVSLPSSDEDDKISYDSRKKKKKSNVPKETVFLSSSDKEEESPKEKSMSDSRKKKKSSDEIKVSTTEVVQTESVVKRSKSDSKDKSEENSKFPKDAVTLSSSEENEKKSISCGSRKKKKKSDKKKSSTREASLIDSEVRISKSESEEKIDENCSHDVDQNEEPSSEEDSQMETVKRIRRMQKRNETPIKCPICTEYRTCVVTTLISHLKAKHSTTLGLNGFFLRCDCGHEAQSERHLTKCKIANYTLIRTREGPIRTLLDEKMTPQCFLCEVYPRTARGYAGHIVQHHHSTLKEEKRYLICSCGHKVAFDNVDPSHKKKCDGRMFTLHKLNDEDTNSD